MDGYKCTCHGFIVLSDYKGVSVGIACNPDPTK